MDNIFLVAGLIAFIFLVIKFLEMKYVEKEYKPLKYLIRDGLAVYISSVLCFIMLEQVKPVVENVVNISNPIAFTDNPPF
jgi:surface polysaccharide O-acyltransferase-like enzyme